VEVNALLQYVANQLKSSESLDLLVLKEMVQTMTVRRPGSVAGAGGGACGIRKTARFSSACKSWLWGSLLSEQGDSAACHLRTSPVHKLTLPHNLCLSIPYCLNRCCRATKRCLM